MKNEINIICTFKCLIIMNLKHTVTSYFKEYLKVLIFIFTYQKNRVPKSLISTAMLLE